MATQQPEDSETGKGDAPNATPTALSASGLSRRSFAKLGAGAGGVILTLASQPGMANSMCVCPSQSLSKWKSTHKEEPPKCIGVPPTWWASPYHSWPKSCDRKTMKFGDMFPCGGRTDYSSCLANKILTLQPFDKDAVGQYFATTYLNIASGKIGFMTIPDLQKIFHEWLATAQYRPSAGVHPWSGAELVSYLKKTTY